jgi:hypothetical protein
MALLAVLFQVSAVEAQAPFQTKFGIYYSGWTCPQAQGNPWGNPIYDISKSLALGTPLGPSGAPHWWAEPSEGYYCLTTPNAQGQHHILTKHAEMLRDAGIDFIFYDASNYPVAEHQVATFQEPFRKLLEVWQGVAGAPKVVPFAPVARTSESWFPGTSYPGDSNSMQWMITEISARGMHFVYQGKPLVIVVDNPGHPHQTASQTRIDQELAAYTVRKMWDYRSIYTIPGSENDWWYLPPCRDQNNQMYPVPAETMDAFLTSRATIPCRQPVTTYPGTSTVEAVTVMSSYNFYRMSLPSEAVPKFYGRTFAKQFETLFNNNTAAISLIFQWNEWTGLRLPDGNFVDLYNHEYSRDMEPSKDEREDFYYQLLKKCIQRFKSGQSCEVGDVFTWSEGFAGNTVENPMVGDFNGDGKTDIVTFTRTNPLAYGDVYVAMSNGSSFGAPSQWSDWFGVGGGEKQVIGDFNGDGKDDMATWLADSSRQVYVGTSYGNGITVSLWTPSGGVASSAAAKLFAGDFNGDSKDDLIYFENGTVWVAISNGSSFEPAQQKHGWFAVGAAETPYVGDLNGDGKTDIITLTRNNPAAEGDVYVAFSNGSAFVDQNGVQNSSTKWSDWFAPNPNERVIIGDYNGDGKDDFMTLMPMPNDEIYIAYSTGTGMTSPFSRSPTYLSTTADVPRVGDANGDGKDDLVIFNQNAGGKVRVHAMGSGRAGLKLQ